MANVLVAVLTSAVVATLISSLVAVVNGQLQRQHELVLKRAESIEGQRAEIVLSSREGRKLLMQVISALRAYQSIAPRWATYFQHRPG